MKAFLTTRQPLVLGDEAAGANEVVSPFFMCSCRIILPIAGLLAFHRSIFVKFILSLYVVNFFPKYFKNLISPQYILLQLIARKWQTSSSGKFEGQIPLPQPAPQCPKKIFYRSSIVSRHLLETQDGLPPPVFSRNDWLILVPGRIQVPGINV